MPSPLEGKRVLLVDDDNDILTSMEAAFEPTGAAIDKATNGNKAQAAQILEIDRSTLYKKLKDYDIDV